MSTSNTNKPDGAAATSLLSSTSPASSKSDSKGVVFNALGQPKPVRPLSAYNYFFKHTRVQVLASMPTRPQGKPRRSHGKIGFADLARTIATRWSSIEPTERAWFDEQAAQDKARYVREMAEWKKHEIKEMDETQNGMMLFHNDMLVPQDDLPVTGVSNSTIGYNDADRCYATMTNNDPTPMSLQSIMTQYRLQHRPIPELASLSHDDDSMNASVTALGDVFDRTPAPWEEDITRQCVSRLAMVPIMKMPLTTVQLPRTSTSSPSSTHDVARLERLVSSMDQDCFDLFVDMFRGID